MTDGARRLGLCPRPRGIFGKMRGAAALLLLPGAGFADAWEAFSNRCLAPMSEVMEADVSGLTAGDPRLAAEHFDPKALTDMRSFALGEESELVLHPGDWTDTPNCLVIADDADGSDGAEAQRWLAVVTDSGAWALDGDGPSGRDYLSTTWREPKLRLTVIDPDGPRLIFVLTETNLES